MPRPFAKTDRSSGASSGSDSRLELNIPPVDLDLGKSRSMTSPLDTSLAGIRFDHHRVAPGSMESPLHTFPPAFGLLQFYRSDDPWNPLPKLPPNDLAGHHGSSVVSYQSGPTAHHFSGYRSTGPSECGTVPPCLPSDSGYASQPRHGGEDASVLGDFSRDQDTQSLTGHFVDFHPFGVSRDPLNRDWRTSPGTQALACPTDADGSQKLVCPTCNKAVKTKSELTKHSQRHTKPHRCDVPGCTRKEGFSTTNDLDRHKRSVHNDASTRGDRYRCNLGQCKNKDKLWPRADNFRSHLKRVHNREVAADEDLGEFIPTTTSPGQEVLQGVGTSVPVEIYDPHAASGVLLPSSFWLHERSPGLEVNDGGAEDEDLRIDDPGQPFQFPHPAELEFDTQLPIARPSAQSVCRSDHKPLETSLSPVVSLDSSRSPEMEKSDINSPPDSQQLEARHTLLKCENRSSAAYPDGSSQDRTRQGIVDAAGVDNCPSHTGARGMSSPSSIQRTNDDLESPSAGDLVDGRRSPETDSPNSKESPDHTPNPFSDEQAKVGDGATSRPGPRGVRRDNSELGKISDVLNGIPRHLIEQYLKKQSSDAVKEEAAETGVMGETNRCERCRRSFARRCELKKHMKRHEKPYGCTFSPCNKRFGSKSDWKRHENSQHFQLEMWKCDERKADRPQEACSKVCHRRETFKYHLQKEHRIQDPTQTEEKLEKCRVGRNCDERFWCGFCRQVIEISQKGASAWSERFDHIDDHYFGRNNVAKVEIGAWKNVDPGSSDADLSPPPEESSSCSNSEESQTPGGLPRSEATGGEEAGLSRSERKRRVDGDLQGGQAKKRRKDAATTMWGSVSAHEQKH